MLHGAVLLGIPIQYAWLYDYTFGSTKHQNRGKCELRNEKRIQEVSVLEMDTHKEEDPNSEWLR